MYVLSVYGLDDIKNSKGIHIAHLNVRSILNKWETFQTQFENSNTHILGLSETWLNDRIPPNFLKLSNDFTFLRNDRNWIENNSNNIKKGRGVGLFINSKLNFCDLTFAESNWSKRDIECHWVTVRQGQYCVAPLRGQY